MILKPAKYKKCKSCGTQKGYEQEVLGCDTCSKELDFHNHLEVNVFKNETTERTETLKFCSWKCVLSKIKKWPCNYFMAIPYLHFDQKIKGIRAEDFFKELR